MSHTISYSLFGVLTDDLQHHIWLVYANFVLICYAARDSSDPSGDLTSPVTPGQGHLMSPGWNTDWIFCGSALSKEEKVTMN